LEHPRPFTLEFPSPQLEAGFENEYRRQPRAYYRTLSVAILGFLVINQRDRILVAFSSIARASSSCWWGALIPLTILAAAALHGPEARRAAARDRRGVTSWLSASSAQLYPAVRADRFLAETYGFSYSAFVLLLALAFGRFAPRSALVLAAILIGTTRPRPGESRTPVVQGHVPLLLGRPRSVSRWAT